MLEHFENGAYDDAPVRTLLGRTHAAAYAGKTFRAADPFDSEVTVTLRDGSGLSESVEYPLGRTAAHPIPDEALNAKFEHCAARALTPDAVREAHRLVAAFETLKSVRMFTQVLRQGCKESPA